MTNQVCLQKFDAKRFDEIFYLFFSELSFPKSLSNYERCFIHQIAQKMGLKSKSTGQKDERFITITKVDEDFVTSFDQNKFHKLDVDPDLINLVQEYLDANPLNEVELAAIEEFATTKPNKNKSKFELMKQV